MFYLPILPALAAVAIAAAEANGAPPAPLKLAKVVDSWMVLQRAPKSASVWGWAAAGATVAVNLDGATGAVSHATADANGSWVARLPPQQASYNRTLTITTAGSPTKTLTGVAFGDVFLCSGQSHMTFSVNQDMNGSATIAESGKYGGIRMLTAQTITSTVPLDDLAAVKYSGPSSWLPSAPKSFGTALFSYPSAICYYHAREIYTHFDGAVPIGIVSSSVGGSAIEFWQSDAARADGACGGHDLSKACPPGSTTGVAKAGGAMAQSANTAPANEPGAVAKERGWTPSCFYNAMIHPFKHMALKGFLWDQGEANNDDCQAYGCKLAAMVHDVRTNLFGQPDIFFTFDQLRPGSGAMGYGAGGYAAAIPNATFASRVDLQTCTAADTSEGHATRKLEVGRRLALATRVTAYGEAPTALSFGPSIAAVSVSAAARGIVNVTVTLTNAQGLHHSDAPECDGCCSGQGGPLIQGTPATGDGWTFYVTGGAVVTVCKTAALGCDGSVTIRGEATDADASVGGAGGGGTATLTMKLVATPFVAGGAVKVEKVVYGGAGPWLRATDSHTSTGSGGGGGGAASAVTTEEQRALHQQPVTTRWEIFANITNILGREPDPINITHGTLKFIGLFDTVDECFAAVNASSAKAGPFHSFTFKAPSTAQPYGYGRPFGRHCYGDTSMTWLNKTYAGMGYYSGRGPGFPVGPPPPQCVYPHPLRFGIEACPLYNGGPGGHDAHAGVVMAAQWWTAP